MKKLHIAISTNKIEETIKDSTARLEAEPCSAVSGEYALWRTETLNVSIRQDPKCTSGELRHLGWENSLHNNKQMKSTNYGLKQTMSQNKNRSNKAVKNVRFALLDNQKPCSTRHLVASYL